jgi:hypothetical protein
MKKSIIFVIVILIFTATVVAQVSDKELNITPVSALGFPNSIATYDFNNDSYIDILTGENDGPFYLYENNGSGNLTANYLLTSNIAAQVGLGVSVADVNNDGYEDFVSCGLHIGAPGRYHAAWYENNGTGNFTEHIFYDVSYPLNLATFRYCQMVDLNGDNEKDLLLYGTGESNINSSNVGSLVMVLNNGSNVFIPAGFFIIENQTYGGYDAIVSDVDGDSDLDIITTDITPNLTISKYTNDGYGNFTKTIIDTCNYTGLSIDSNDMNNDSYDDIIAECDGIKIYYNDGSGGFSSTSKPYSEVNNTALITTGDLNNDGYNDIFWVEGNISSWQFFNSYFIAKYALYNGINYTVYDVSGDTATYFSRLQLVNVIPVNINGVIANLNTGYNNIIIPRKWDGGLILQNYGPVNHYPVFNVTFSNTSINWAETVDITISAYDEDGDTIIYGVDCSYPQGGNVVMDTNPTKSCNYYDQLPLVNYTDRTIRVYVSDLGDAWNIPHASNYSNYQDQSVDLQLLGSEITMSNMNPQQTDFWQEGENNSNRANWTTCLLDNCVTSSSLPIDNITMIYDINGSLSLTSDNIGPSPPFAVWDLAVARVGHANNIVAFNVTVSFYNTQTDTYDEFFNISAVDYTHLFVCYERAIYVNKSLYWDDITNNILYKLHVEAADNDTTGGTGITSGGSCAGKLVSNDIGLRLIKSLWYIGNNSVINTGSGNGGGSGEEPEILAPIVTCDPNTDPLCYYEEPPEDWYNATPLNESFSFDRYNWYIIESAGRRFYDDIRAHNKVNYTLSLAFTRDNTLSSPETQGWTHFTFSNKQYEEIAAVNLPVSTLFSVYRYIPIEIDIPRDAEKKNYSIVYRITDRKSGYSRNLVFVVNTGDASFLIKLNYWLDGYLINLKIPYCINLTEALDGSCSDTNLRILRIQLTRGAALLLLIIFLALYPSIKGRIQRERHLRKLKRASKKR